jgi:hypothetical protein
MCYNWERTNYFYCNRGILTVGLKSEIVEIVCIIFPRPRPPNFVGKKILKQRLYIKLYQI